mmetsp:Transcript_25646/g.46409  ORF Transcript_25646/g.46409 Transcript_25646/m.46409 type:complete len:316 (-) Transcript_25646:163-1110(-)
MSSQTYTFGDDAIPAVRPNQKHRRRGPFSRRKNGNAATASSSSSSSGSNGHHHNGQQQQQQQQTTTTLTASRLNQPQSKPHFSADGWDNIPISSGQNNDDTNSLNYSTSSSVVSAESSSNSSCFADLMQKVDSDGDLKEFADPEIKDFMAKQTRAANDGNARVGHGQYGKMRGMGMDMPVEKPLPAAVKQWNQRREKQQYNNQQNHHHQQAHQQAQHNQQARHQQKQKKAQYGVASKQQSHAASGDLHLEYSRDSDFSEQEEHIRLETIAGKRDEDNNIAGLANVRITASSEPQAASSSSSNNNNNNSDHRGIRV